MEREIEGRISYFTEYGKWKAKKIVGRLNKALKVLFFDAQLKTFRGDINTEGTLSQLDKGLRFQCKTSFKALEAE